MADSQKPSDRQAPDEFTRLFTTSQRPIYLYIRSLVANAADVEELWQETNLVLWQRFASFEPGTNFLAWAKQIAYNKVLNYRTRRHRPLQFSDAFMERLAEASKQTSDRNGLRLVALNRCVEKLVDEDRELIHLRYSPGVTCEILAQALDRSVRSVYKAVARIRATLLGCVRQEMAREDME